MVDITNILPLKLASKLTEHQIALFYLAVCKYKETGEVTEFDDIRSEVFFEQFVEEYNSHKLAEQKMSERMSSLAKKRWAMPKSK